MRTKKLDHDRMNHRTTAISNIRNTIPTREQCGLTQTRDTLDNDVLSNRNNCEMIQAFKDNPYTQPLNSIR